MTSKPKQQLNLLDSSTPAWKLILMLAWPTVVEQLLQTAVNYVDTAMVGYMGTNATAAVGLTSSTIWLLLGVMNAAGVGYSVMVARRLGAGRPDEAREVIRQAVLSIAVIGAFLTLLVELIIAPNLPLWMKADPEIAPLSTAYFRIIGSAYFFNTSLVVCSNILRCTGDTKTPLKFNLATNLINVVGNFLLIYPTRQITIFDLSFTMPGAGWGVAGAAAATALATAFSGGSMLLMLFRRRVPTQIHLSESFRPRPVIIRQAVSLGVPSLLERATISVGQIVSTALITSLGTVSLAAHQLANTGESICYMPVFGFSIAATTLVAQNLGGGKKDRAYRLGGLCTLMGIGVMTVMGSAMFLFAPQILRFFTREPAVIALGAKMLRIEAFVEPLVAVGNVLGGVLRGAGDTRWPFYISVAGMWLVRLPLAFLLIRFFSWDLTAVWLAMALDWVVRGAISFVRFRRRKWLDAWKDQPLRAED